MKWNGRGVDYTNHKVNAVMTISQSWQLQINGISKFCRNSNFNPMIEASECVCVSLYVLASMLIVAIFSCIGKLPVWIYGIQKTCHRSSPTGHMDKNISHCNCRHSHVIAILYLYLCICLSILTPYFHHRPSSLSLWFQCDERGSSFIYCSHHYYCYANIYMYISKCEWVASGHYNGMNIKIAF